MAMIKSLRHRLQMWEAFYEMVNIVPERYSHHLEGIGGGSHRCELFDDFHVGPGLWSICSGKYAIVCDRRERMAKF